MLTIKKANLEDAQALTHIFLSARREMSYLPKLHTDEETLWWMTNVVLKENDVRVAWDLITPVGFLAKQGNLIEHLYIAPSHQSQKIGSRLLKEVMNETDSLTLWVFQENMRGRLFYKKLGFVLTQETDGSRNEEKVPDAQYHWIKD